MLIARRVVVHSAEDVGLADPNALVVATSALTALQNIGMPEGILLLTEAIIYVCEAEKSNSVVVARDRSGRDAEDYPELDVPAHLKNYVFSSNEEKKNIDLYKYPHDFGGYVEQQYLPDGIKGNVYYTPKNNGYENVVKEIRKNKGKK